MPKNRRGLFRNDRGEVGIGTLIVFIAMILVAAVAAAVLVNTSGLLQQRALSTGKATTNEIASSLKILDVFGNRSSASGDVRGISVHLQLNAGALATDVDRLWIHYVDEAGAVGVKKGGAMNATTFTYAFARENGTPNSRLEGGEIVALNWIVNIAPREHVVFTLHPEAGQQAVADFHAPLSYNSAMTIPLL